MEQSPDENKKENKKIPDKSEAGAFSKLNSFDGLIRYLDDGHRLSYTENLYHYTTLDVVTKIFNSSLWLLGSAKNMNDLLEYKNGEKNRWEHLFFASFMGEEKESIGMWSMYAQPWKTGVKIEVPKKTLTNLLKKTKQVHLISKSNPNWNNPVPVDGKDCRVWISRVAYSNQEEREKNDEEKLTCGGEENTILRDAIGRPELTGYIKDSAWSYEKEFRLKAEAPDAGKFEYVGIDLTDDFLNSIRIISSPLFEGDLVEELRKSIQRECKTSKSLFTDKMKYTTPCDKCDLQRKNMGQNSAAEGSK